MAQNIPIVVADVELQLSTAIAVGATTFSVASANDDDGVALPAGKYCFTIDNGKSNKEYLMGQLNGLNVTSVVSVSRQGVESAGASEKHRIGSSCIITDFATIQRVADTLRGVVALNGATPVVYDTEPTLADRKELATVGYVLDTATGGTVNFDAQTVSATAGEDIVAGELVYFKTSDQEWYKTDADTAATVEGVQLGIALGAGSDGAAITGGVLVNGIYTTTGLTAGSEYYASNTAGAYSTSAGTTSRKIGLALSTTQLFLYTSNSLRITDTEKIFLENLTSGNSTLQPQIVSFTSSGTWTKDAGLKYIIVEGVGGGGGGGYAYSSDFSRSAGGGGSGGYFKKVILAASLGATETVTVGTGGAGGTSGARTGVTGGTTTFGAHCTAVGGAGGGDMTGNLYGAGGGGGIASGGDINISGNPGVYSSGAIGNNGHDYSSPGIGGASVLGAYGSGGQGGYNGNGAGGSNGFVTVTEYYS